MSQYIEKIADRAIALLYFYAVVYNKGVSLKQIISDFHDAGLAKPNITKLRAIISKDKRTTKVSKDEWRLKSDKISEVEKEFQLNQCFGKKIKTTPIIEQGGAYINKKRFGELKKTNGNFDLSRLVQMLSELEQAFVAANYISVILLVRAILDHIPPIFGKNTFMEVTNNYGGKSFKDSMLNLNNSSRKIADTHLHTQIRRREALPNETQVNFSNDLDVLLAEIIRIS